MRAELFVGLHINTIRTVIEIEIVDVGRTHVDAEGVGDLAERDVQALGFFAIDGDDILRIARGVGGEESGEVFAPEASAREVVGDFVEILKTVIALIQEFELEPAELAETLHGGRFEGDDNGTGNSEQWAAQSIEDCGGGVVMALALRVRPEGQKYQAGVGRAASEAETGDGERTLDFRKTLGDGGHLVADFPRVFERCSSGSLDHDDEISLIFVGDEALRHMPEDKVSETKSGGKQD